MDGSRSTTEQISVSPDIAPADRYTHLKTYRTSELRSMGLLHEFQELRLESASHHVFLVAEDEPDEPEEPEEVPRALDYFVEPRAPKKLLNRTYVASDAEAVRRAEEQPDHEFIVRGKHGDTTYCNPLSLFSVKSPKRNTSVTRSPTRARGAGRPKARSASARSSAKSGDSGDDSSGSQPGRCEVCSDPIPEEINGRKVRSDCTTCSDAHRKELSRQRKRASTATTIRPAAPHAAADNYFSFVGPEGQDERPQIVARVNAGCRCNGHHIADEDGLCVKCGHVRYPALWEQASRNLPFIRAFSCEREHPRPLARMGS